MDASEIHARRHNAKEVLTPESVENFIVPIADGKVKLSGRDQVLRTHTLSHENPERGEGPEDLRRESDGFPQPTHDISPMKVKRGTTSGRLRATTFTVISSSCECLQ